MTNIPSMEKKKVVVAGGAGFIGRHLVASLVRMGHEVYVIDNASSGPSWDYRLRNNDQLKPIVGAYWWFADIVCTDERNEKVWQELHNADIVYNLACPASPGEYQRNPQNTLDTCYLGTKNLLSAVGPGIKFIQASTSEIYGDPNCEIQSEHYRGNVNTMGPRSCYDEGKRVAESLCYTAAAEEGVDARVVRIFNTFGPGMPASDGRVVSNFASQIINNQPITIYGSGEQTRSFCYVGRLVEMLLRVGFAKEWDGLPMNIGDVQVSSVSELASRMIQVHNEHPEIFGKLYEPEITYRPMPGDDPSRRLPDLSRYISKFGQPKTQVDLDVGLLETLRWMKKHVKSS